MKSNFLKRIDKAKKSIEKYTGENHKIETGVILGSGLSGVIEDLEGTNLPYKNIKGMPETGIKGHKSILKITDNAFIFAGRFHYYEGRPMDDVVFQIFVLHSLGVKRIIITNAAGAVNKSFNPGDLVIIKDHINLMGTNPLIGKNILNNKPRFPDMSDTYSAELSDICNSVSQEILGKELKKGVYAAMSGPSYETPSEIKMLNTIGADLVGMSTVPEAISASYLGMEVLGISCVTNMASGILEKKLDHSEVIETGKKVENDLKDLVFNLLKRL